MLRGGLEEMELETSDFPTEYTMEGRESEGLESRLMDRYKLGAKLGEGGFGVVFDARQMQPIQRQVAVKVLKADMNARQIIARFEAERQALAMMDHPGISRVLDAGETQDGRPFFVMEKVDGVPVTLYVRQNNPPLLERLRVFISICEAVHYAHQKGVIHRDLKPSNILVSLDNGVARPKVIDFGLAKALDARLSKRTIYTLHDQVIGTPGYIGPEQIERGAEAADVRGDVYSLGALFYEMLTGAPAVDQKSLIGKPLEEALREAAGRTLVRPSVRDPKLRGDLECIILKALAADPAQRYASADALAIDVQRHLDGQPVQAHPADRLYIIGKFTRRHRWAVAAALALLLAGITALWSSAQQLRQEQRHQAERQRDSSRKYFQDARQYSERGRNGDAIAQLCYALREDRQNSAAATYLSALLSQHFLGHRLAANLRVKAGWSRVSHLAVNAHERTLVAVCAADIEGKSDLIMRWDLDPNSVPPVELGLPAGMKVTACLNSVDDRFLLIGFNEGSLARYDIKSGIFSQFEAKMQGQITAIALSADGSRAFAGTAVGEVRLWDLNRQQPAGPTHTWSGPVELVALDAAAHI
ncbi:MAG: WD40 repeat domain-containing serine/threonine protein kinase, partial [Prosthecobacter sp.]